MNTQNNWKIFEDTLQNTSYFLQSPITEQLIISSTSIGESNNPTSLRFTNNKNWIELQIHYQ